MTKELIEEALRWANGHPNRRSSELMRALVDELAARQPTEGEYILKLIESVKGSRSSVEIDGVKIMPCDEYGRTAAVPDAATERERRLEAHDHIEDGSSYLDCAKCAIDAARAERDAALAAIERCRALVAEWKHEGPSGLFPDRISIDVGVEVIEPLLAALDGAPEPEDKP